MEIVSAIESVRYWDISESQEGENDPHRVVSNSIVLSGTSMIFQGILDYFHKL